MNKADPDSRMMRTQGQPTVQGNNAQAAVTRGQIIGVAEIAVERPDFGHLEPAVRATLRELEDAGVTQRPETVLADAGYWHTRQIENIVSDGLQVLVAPDAGLPEGARPGWDKGPYAFMRRVLSSEAGHELYKHRKATVEPVFAQNKFNRLPPLPATRQSRGAVGVAVPVSNPQPAEVPHPLDKPSDRLSGRDRRRLPLMTSHRSQTKTPRSPNFARQPRRRAVGFAACQEKKRMSSTCALWVLVSALVAMPSSSTTPPRIFRTAVYPGSRMR
jgi:hypothetical protein